MTLADRITRPGTPGRHPIDAQCPQCRGNVSAGDQFCMHCGVQLVANVRRCGRCGAYPDVADRYCIFCGETLVKEMATA